MAECIDRQKAIEQIKAEWAKLPLTETTGFGILMRVLKSIPAADVRPVVRGTWDMYKDGSGVCSVCGKAQFQHWDDGKPDRFCHFCGTRMEEN